MRRSPWAILTPRTDLAQSPNFPVVGRGTKLLRSMAPYAPSNARFMFALVQCRPHSHDCWRPWCKNHFCEGSSWPNCAALEPERENLSDRQRPCVALASSDQIAATNTWANVGGEEPLYARIYRKNAGSQMEHPGQAPALLLSSDPLIVDTLFG